MRTSIREINRWTRGLSVVVLIAFSLFAVHLARTQRDETHSLIAFSNDSGIVIMNPDGSQQRELGVLASQPQWSPDGQGIALLSREPSDVGETFNQVYLFEVNSGELLPLTNLDGSKNYPRWSPDGSWIAFTNSEAGIPQDEIYLVRPDGSQLTRVTNTPDADEQLLSWTPDGQHLLIRSVQGIESGVFQINLDGTGLAPQPMFPPRTLFAAWSPDTQRIAIGVYDAGQYKIHIMNADGSGSLTIPPNELDGVEPTWSPDSQYIAFSSGVVQIGNTNIFTVRYDGTDLTALTDTRDNHSPTWSPILPGPAPTAAPSTLTPIPVTLTPSALECSDAPPSRLNIGMSAAVVTPTEQEPERQNLRVRDAAEGDPVDLLEPGTGFRIVGGPECGAAGQRWWEIETLDGSVRGWSVEGFAPDDYLMVPF